MSPERAHADLTGPRIRIATPADIPEMHRIRMSVHQNRLSDPDRVRAEDYRRLLEREGRGWVAELGPRIAGFAVCDVARSSVWALFVEPGSEGRGIGRRLHDAMLDWLFAGGTELVRLSTDPGTRAEALYLAAGWSRAGLEESGEVRYEMPRDRWLSSR